MIAGSVIRALLPYLAAGLVLWLVYGCPLSMSDVRAIVTPEQPESEPERVYMPEQFPTPMWVGPGS